MSLPHTEGIILLEVKTSPSCVNSLSTHSSAGLRVFIDEEPRPLGACR